MAVFTHDVPVVQNDAQVSKLEAGSACENSSHYYTNPAYLAACPHVVLRKVTTTKSGKTREHSICYAEFPKHLGRLEEFEAEEIELLADKIFAEPSVDFFALEDIVLNDLERAAIARPLAAFSYQSNWVIRLSKDSTGMSSRLLRNLRKYHERLTDELGVEPEFIFRKCTKEDVALVKHHNRLRFEEIGQKYHEDAASQAIMNEVCEKIGYFGGYFHQGKFISGNVVYVTQSRAYGILTGYDSSFRQYSPGLLTHKRIIDQLIEMGITEKNMLWGDGAYKSRLGAKPQPLTTLFIAKNRFVCFTPAFIWAAAAYAWKQLRCTLKDLLARIGRKKRA